MKKWVVGAVVYGIWGGSAVKGQGESQQPRVIDIPIPPGYVRGYSFGISPNGRYVSGEFVSAALAHAFRWTEETGSEVLTIDRVTIGRKVADDGTVMATRGTWADERTFIWRLDGVLDQLGPEFDRPSARGIAMSADGRTVLVGFSDTNNFVDYLWRRDLPTLAVPRLSGTRFALNREMSADGRFVVGHSGNSGSLWIPTRWRVGDERPEIIVPPAGENINADAMAVSAGGHVIWGTQTNPRPAVFRWTEATGSIAMPGIAGYTDSIVSATIPDGRLALGQASSSDRRAVDVVWGPGGAYELLPRLAELGVDLDGRTVTAVIGLSADATRIAVNLDGPTRIPYPAVIVVHGLLRACDADFNGDGYVNDADLAAFAVCFDGGEAPAGSRGADYGGDGFIDMFDWVAFVDAFEAGC